MYCGTCGKQAKDGNETCPNCQKNIWDGKEFCQYKQYRLVPLLDFSHLWTDQMLYDKYGISPDEIEYIEKTIKPME